MVVYLDVLIFVNFIMDFFILFITAQTLRIKFSYKYGVLASVVGSIYAITSIIPKLFVLTSLPFVVLVALIMIFIGFRKKDILFNIKATMVYMLYAMLIGGMCFFIVYSHISDNIKIVSSNFSYKELIVSLMIIYIIINRLVTYVKDRKEITQLIFNIDIIIDENKKSVRAFLDTGNELREPATNLPVLIVERDIFYDINLNKYDKFSIPYNVINGNTASLIGFKPNYITINIQGEIQTRNVIVAFCENRLSNLKDYEALLPRGII